MTTDTKNHIIDAAGKKLGRVATEAAVILRGKNDASFQPHQLSGNKVHIINASKVVLEPVKLETEYHHHTGYHGGLKTQTRAEVIQKKGYAEIFVKAVKGMIPSNKLKAPIMKNLTVSE